MELTLNSINLLSDLYPELRPVTFMTVAAPSGNYNFSHDGAATENKPGYIFHSRDCLKDYHRLLSMGFQVISRPDYTEQGLAASFCDSKGVVFSILEKRNYLDN